jgi:hypothetical protein
MIGLQLQQSTETICDEFPIVFMLEIPSSIMVLIVVVGRLMVCGDQLIHPRTQARHRCPLLDNDKLLFHNHITLPFDLLIHSRDVNICSN